MLRQPPPIDNLGFLLAKASQRWNELLVAAFAAAGYRSVRASYGSVLLPLWQEDGLRMGVLSERARLSKQTMTTLVRLAERDGLVERRPDPADRRSTRVWLTAEAVAFGPVAGASVDQLERRVEAALGPATVRTVHQALATMMNLETTRATNQEKGDIAMPLTATTPTDVITLFSAALHDGRVEDALSLYEADAVFIPQPGAEPLAGLDAISDALAQFAALRPTMTSDIRKVVIAGDVATVLNAWRLHGTNPDGSPVDMQATSADVMRRRPDGSWAILIDDPWGA